MGEDLRAYLSTSLSHAAWLRESWVPIFQGVGFEIISSWLFEDDHDDSDYEACEEGAEAAYQEIMNCNAFFHFPQPGSRGGQFSELGCAYALGKKIFIVSKEPTTLFHYLPEVHFIWGFEGIKWAKDVMTTKQPGLPKET